ncbi:PREDICTED: DNA repair protein complementing XP-C cells-like [Branchiostoma belcheri]|uniref:DNA repair protein complementing XP-C cells-like n=1 Tax=Branchiostoma belcheri TaxID=7741 RepID=A0A6P4ZSG2_BRABE|nr:PREDICTED: DNA repair protein complementing XP-C cells-like [Branchiostoma belcheri]
MGRQRRSIRGTAANGGGKSAGQPNSGPAESEPKSPSADHKLGVKRASAEAGPTNKRNRSRRVPVVVLENLQESELGHLGSKKSNKSKKQAEANDDKPRNGRSVKTLTNSSEVEKCVSGKGQGRKRPPAKSSSGASTQVDNGDRQGKEESISMRKGPRRKRTHVGGHEKDWFGEEDSDFDDGGRTNLMVKKMKTKEEPVEVSTSIHDKEEVEDKASSSEAELPDAPKKPSRLTEPQDSSDSELEWEDVEEIHTAKSPEKKLQDISIELPQDAIPGLSRNKKRKQFDWNGYIKREIRRITKEQRESLHKAHLLSLLACVLYRSRVCNDTDLAGMALSLTPPEILRQRRWDLAFLSKVVRWFQSKFPLIVDEEESEDDSSCTSVTLGRRLEEGKVRSAGELVWLFVVLLRMLQVDTRLVSSLQPIPLKEPSPSKSKQKMSPGQKKPQKSATTKSRAATSKTQASKSAKKTRTVKQAKPGKRGKTAKLSDESSTESSSVKMSDQSSSRHQKTKNSRPRRHASKTKPIVEASESDEEESCHSDYVPEFSTDMNYSSSRESEREVEEINISDDSDLEIVDVSKLRIKQKSGKQNLPPSRKIISDDDSDESVVEVGSKNAVAMSGEWVEVYLVEEERWVTVDVVSGLVDRPELLEQQQNQPMVYVVGVDTEGSVKDVTKRYAAGWMTSTRLLREDRHGTWWTDTLRLYSSSDKDRSKKEDIELHSKLLQKPLPTTIRDFKDHPLYMLRRHLLKYEAIYPETAAVLGYCKGEPVYARECVHQLHTRDKWLQEARVVRPGEVPYKMVKHNRPDMVKKKMERKGIFTTGHEEEPTVALFGRWQTEDYMPPLAVDGKVPRNDYGNVDLYLPSMLPQGTVHLQIPGLERVARKLDIDCAPAVVGFDFHSGWSHPVKDGFIVCEEHKEVLLAAWEEDRQNREQKVKDKREKRALDNWRKLTKALLISQRLKRRYQIQNESKDKSSLEGEDIDDEDNFDETSDRAVDVEQSWPRKDFSQEASSSKTSQARAKKKQKEDAHLFPFEKI